MEIACLKIKFIPLIKETQKNNSKCYLEIVPEVSYIKNLDKLIWRHDTCCLEYSIPMRHKIILRKERVKDEYEEIVKTYHSCVDLLVPASNTNNIGSGDIYTILSDTILVNNGPGNVQQTENIVNHQKSPIKLLPEKENNKKKLTDAIDPFDMFRYSPTIKSEVLQVKESITISMEQEETNNDLGQSRTEQLLFKRKVCTYDKSINTDNISTIHTTSEDKTLPKKLSNSREFKHKLNLSPICSIDTEEFTSSIIDTSSSKLITRLKESHIDFDFMSNHSNGNPLSFIISQFEWLSQPNSIKSIHFSSSYRSPEIRVAQYVHYIKKELLPLNLVLEKLIEKCSMIGVPKVTSSVSKFQNKNASSSDSEAIKYNRVAEFCEKSESNRAVYTIVLNE